MQKANESSRKKVLLIGGGGWAREHWIANVWPDFKDKVQIVGLVDINKNILKDSGRMLGLSEEALFKSIDEAFKKTKPDFCTIVIPPHVHKTAYDIAIAHNVPILSEKPITDKLSDTLAVYKSIKKKKLKMAVIQNYRYEGPIMTVKNILDSKRLGKIDYIVARYASDYRKPGSWDVGSVYEMENPLLVEGSIHHFDMIRYLASSNFKTVQGIGWNPSWSAFKNNSAGLHIMTLENGVKAMYEGNSNEAGNINRWHQEYYRVECEKGAIVVNRDKLVRIYKRNASGLLNIEIPPIVPAPPSGHHKILTDFINWLNGGIAPETEISDNIQSAIAVFAAIDANNSGCVKDVQTYVPKS